MREWRGDDQSGSALRPTVSLKLLTSELSECFRQPDAELSAESGHISKILFFELVAAVKFHRPLGREHLTA